MKLQGKVQSYRRAKGIRPFLPWPEDREAVKEEYIKKFNLQGIKSKSQTDNSKDAT
jgi:hypothetical protein